MPNYGPAPDDRRGDANERQSGIDVEVVSPVPVHGRSSDIVVKPLEWQSRGARSLALLVRRIETARAAHERIDATRQAREAAEQASEKAEAELHAKLLAKNATYDGMYAVLEETKQDRMVVAPQLRNAGQTVVFARDPDYRPVRIAELALRDRQADFEAALKARLPAGWEGDVDAPDFISLADVEPWLTALLGRIRALRDFQPSGDAAVSLTAHDLRNFYRILDHLQINDRPTRPPTPPTCIKRKPRLATCLHGSAGDWLNVP